MKTTLRQLDNLRQIISPQDAEALAKLVGGTVWSDLLFESTQRHEEIADIVGKWCSEHNIKFPA